MFGGALRGKRARGGEKAAQQGHGCERWSKTNAVPVGHGLLRLWFGTEPGENITLSCSQIAAARG
jgi:hypothetical protein